VRVVSTTEKEPQTRKIHTPTKNSKRTPYTEPVDTLPGGYTAVVAAFTALQFNNAANNTQKSSSSGSGRGRCGRAAATQTVGKNNPMSA
jgi:hypothetical protein